MMVSWGRRRGSHMRQPLHSLSTTRRLKWAVLLFVLAFAGKVHASSAEGLTFSSLHSDITINTDASIQVTETLVTQFTTEHHGIYRWIPFSYTTLNGGRASIPITITSVKRNDADTPYTTTISGPNVQVKIGDPQQTLTGQQTYTIAYTAEAATNFFSDHDELYWNVSGSEWDAPLERVTSTIRLPSDVGSSSLVQTNCYTGTYGSTEQNCLQVHNTVTADFSAESFLTAVVSWPTGIVIRPDNYDALRTQGTIAPPNQIFQQPSVLVLLLNFLSVIAAVMLMARYWTTHGRDLQAKKPIIAQYEPPDDLRPAEAYALLHEQVSMKAVLPATIVDLAVRGYVQIREVEQAKFLGLGKKTDYELQRVKPIDETLRDGEASILTTLFDLKYTDAAEQPTVLLSSLQQRKYTANPFQSAVQASMDRLVHEGYFTRSPITSKILVGVIGAAVLGLTGFLLSSGIFAWGGLVVGLIVFGFLPSMPQRSVKGAEAAWHAQGFRLFIEKAEQYRIHWQERENIFELYLPYAMVFGLADKWSKALADVARQPEWFTGSSNHAFTTMYFLSAMNSFSTVSTASVVSAAASGSSGMSGGFSGGGGGGGGGGGW